MNIQTNEIIKIIKESSGINIENVDDNIFEYGLDSVSILEVIFQIENVIKIEFSPTDLSLDNFSTVRNITRIIDQVTTKENM